MIRHKDPPIQILAKAGTIGFGLGGQSFGFKVDVRVHYISTIDILKPRPAPKFSMSGRLEAFGVSLLQKPLSLQIKSLESLSRPNTHGNFKIENSL